MKNLEQLNGMVKEDLVEYILKLQESRNSGIKRKDEVLALIENEPMSIDTIAETLGINKKNISSQLSYLRKDGYQIMNWTDKDTKERMYQIMG